MLATSPVLGRLIGRPRRRAVAVVATVLAGSVVAFSATAFAAPKTIRGQFVTDDDSSIVDRVKKQSSTRSTSTTTSTTVFASNVPTITLKENNARRCDRVKNRPDLLEKWGCPPVRTSTTSTSTTSSSTSTSTTSTTIKRSTTVNELVPGKPYGNNNGNGSGTDKSSGQNVLSPRAQAATKNSMANVPVITLSPSTGATPTTAKPAPKPAAPKPATPKSLAAAPTTAKPVTTTTVAPATTTTTTPPATTTTTAPAKAAKGTLTDLSGHNSSSKGAVDKYLLPAAYGGGVIVLLMIGIAAVRHFRS